MAPPKKAKTGRKASWVGAPVVAASLETVASSMETASEDLTQVAKLVAQKHPKVADEEGELGDRHKIQKHQFSKLRAAAAAASGSSDGGDSLSVSEAANLAAQKRKAALLPKRSLTKKQQKGKKNVGTVDVDEGSDVDRLLDQLGDDARRSAPSERWDPLDSAIFSDDEIELMSSNGVPRARTKFSWFSFLFKLSIGVALLGVICAIKIHEDSFRSLTRHSQGSGMDLYADLGVSRNASRSQIRKAYRELSRKIHPDKVQGPCPDCAERFERVASAYRILNNVEARRLFDSTGYLIREEAKGLHQGLALNELHLTPSVHTHQILPSLLAPGSTPPIKLGSKYSESPTGVWVILVVEPRASVTSHLTEMWKEYSTWFDGLATFVRVSSEDLDALKLLPVKIRVAPAIVMLKPNDQPELFVGIAELSSRRFIEWMFNGFPKSLKRAVSDTELETIVAAIAERRALPASRIDSIKAKYLGAPLDKRMPILHVSPRAPSLFYRAAALRESGNFRWFYARESDHLRNLLLSHGVAMRPGEEMLLAPSLDNNSDKMRKIELLADLNGKTSTLLQEGKSRKLMHKLMDTMRSLEQDTIIPLSQKSFEDYCHYKKGQDSYCLIVPNDQTDTIALRKLKDGALAIAEKQRVSEQEAVEKDEAGDSGVESSYEYSGDDEEEPEEQPSKKMESAGAKITLLSVDPESLAFRQSSLSSLVPRKLLESGFAILPNFSSGKMFLYDSNAKLVRERSITGCDTTKTGRIHSCLSTEKESLMQHAWRKAKSVVLF